MASSNVSCVAHGLFVSLKKGRSSAYCEIRLRSPGDETTSEVQHCILSPAECAPPAFEFVLGSAGKQFTEVSRYTAINQIYVCVVVFRAKQRGKCCQSRTLMASLTVLVDLCRGLCLLRGTRRGQGLAKASE